jgi:GT2 family glycosyltransferase
MVKLSVIIPTLNRCALLRNAILSAREQTLPADRYEIIVVDNGSTDDTAKLIRQIGRSSDKSVRYVYESRLGLHNARHAGARAALSDLLVFTDDDATFERRWLESYVGAFHIHSKMVAAAGPILPIWEMTPPQWILKCIGHRERFPIFSLMKPYKEFRLNSKEIFFGVNLAIRRCVLFEVGGFNPEAFGDIWLGDGETGLNRKLWSRHMLVGHVPGAIAYHHIPAERMTLEYFCRRMANEGACDMYALFHEKMPHPAMLLFHAGCILARNGKSWILSRQRRGQTDVRSLDVQMRAARTMSQLRYVLRLLTDRKLQQLVTRKSWLDGYQPRGQVGSGRLVRS